MRIKVRERKSKSKILLIAIILFAILLLFSAGRILLKVIDVQYGYFSGEDSEELKDKMVYGGKVYKKKDGIETLLLLGLDAVNEDEELDSYNNNMKSDFLMLLVIDNVTDECTAVQINRDTMADMSVLGVAGDRIGTVNKQIALAHTYGNGRQVSCRNVAESVSSVFLNIDIDDYVSVKMDAVPIYNDLLGGVDVEIADDFTGIDDTLIQGETVTLFGEHSLNFVRARQGVEDGTNISRMERQKTYMKSAYEKTKQCLAEDSSFPATAYLKTADYIVSNCTDAKLQSYIKKVCNCKFNGIKNVEGKSVLGDKYMEFYPDKDSIQKLVIDLFYE